MAVVTYSTLEHVAQEARPYPVAALEGCETGLVLFAAAFLGHNDAIHFAEAGMHGTCIDIDEGRLLEMRELYPDDWEWLAADAWDTARTLVRLGQTYDVVSVDTFTGEAERRSLASLSLWASLARKMVTVTVSAGSMYKVPTGWKAYHMARSQTVFWMVLTRA